LRHSIIVHVKIFFKIKSTNLLKTNTELKQIQLYEIESLTSVHFFSTALRHSVIVHVKMKQKSTKLLEAYRIKHIQMFKVESLSSVHIVSTELRHLIIVHVKI
jgi:hypothetical protein